MDDFRRQPLREPLPVFVGSRLILRMAKKSAKAVQRSGQQLTVRCTDEDVELFERAAGIEGADSAQRWMVQVCRRRARAIVEASKAGGPVTITETVIVPASK
jgi:uncharacterized protein (DUF1778 family)